MSPVEYLKIILLFEVVGVAVIAIFKNFLRAMGVDFRRWLYR